MALSVYSTRHGEMENWGGPNQSVAEGMLSAMVRDLGNPPVCIYATYHPASHVLSANDPTCSPKTVGTQSSPCRLTPRTINREEKCRKMANNRDFPDPDDSPQDVVHIDHKQHQALPHLRVHPCRGVAE